ncbi:hypothetical protein, partial [Bradyrhizobium sp.]|uniref:hypothetical protein n=1 Tax=Bradyrhizobium sp. TaxID=376 RepID=UPI003C71F721
MAKDQSDLKGIRHALIERCVSACGAGKPSSAIQGLISRDALSPQFATRGRFGGVRKVDGDEITLHRAKTYKWRARR